MAGQQVTNFALIGAAGYIAPRHLKAISEVGGNLLAAVDPHDSVGVLDRYFPAARFFVEIERFDRFLEKKRRGDPSEAVRYLSVCSPNYLHDAHARLGLRVQADVICEKPLTISPWNVDALAELEAEHERRIYTVLQLRLHPAIVALREQLAAANGSHRAQVCLSYVTRRGPWYGVSWKGDPAKSGGVAMNIGVHFFDLLLYLFGECERCEMHMNEPDKMSGLLELKNADVTWYLSLDEADLPERHRERGLPAHRSLTIDGMEVDFSDGFTELHTEVYRDVLAGGGFGLEEARRSVELVHRIRNAEIAARPAALHPALQKGGAQAAVSSPPEA